MAAAPADFRPDRRSARPRSRRPTTAPRRPSSSTQNPDILAEISHDRARDDAVIVGLRRRDRRRHRLACSTWPGPSWPARAATCSSSTTSAGERSSAAPTTRRSILAADGAAVEVPRGVEDRAGPRRSGTRSPGDSPAETASGRCWATGSVLTISSTREIASSDVAGRLFTSESVTEGHPDKIADRISDSVLDYLMGARPRHREPARGRRDAADHRPRRRRRRGPHRPPTRPVADIVRKAILDIGYDSSDKGFDGAHLRRPGRHRRPVHRHRRRRRRRPRVAGRLLRGRARQARRRRPGPDVRLRLRRHPRADAAADHDRPAPRPAADRGPQGRHARLPASRRQDPGHHRVRRGRPPGAHRHRRALHPARPGRRARPRSRPTSSSTSSTTCSPPSTSPPRATGCWSTRPARSSSAARWATPA